MFKLLKRLFGIGTTAYCNSDDLNFNKKNHGKCTPITYVPKNTLQSERQRIQNAVTYLPQDVAPTIPLRNNNSTNTVIDNDSIDFDDNYIDSNDMHESFGGGSSGGGGCSASYNDSDDDSRNYDSSWDSSSSCDSNSDW